jgi:hypothetical protein
MQESFNTLRSQPRRFGLNPGISSPVLDTLVPPWTQILVDFLVYYSKRKDREDSAIFQVKMIFPSISPHLPQY